MANDLDEFWLDWARTTYIELNVLKLKFYFERLASLSRMPPDQRERLMQAAADFGALLDASEEVRFRPAFHAWMHDNSDTFKRDTLASLGCDPEAWKRELKT